MTTAKRLLALGIAVLSAGCAAGRPRAAMQPTEVRIPVGATRTVDGGDLAISFARVSEDSRCPRNVQCVTAGNAVVALLLQERGQASRAVDLNTGQEPRSATYQGYVVELVALEPVPEQGRTPTNYVAVLRVTEEK